MSRHIGQNCFVVVFRRGQLHSRYLVFAAAEPASTKWGVRNDGGPGKIFGTTPLRTLGNAHFKYRNAPI